MEPDATPERSLLGVLLGGKYRITRLLGEGGVGVVYEAENSWTGRRVALKVLRPEFAARREVVRRFKREAQAATQINHPHIVDVLDMGEDRAHGTLYIVQELLTGTDLRCWLDRKNIIGSAETVEILTPVMGALVAAHRRGIIHRDIKPENIFLVRGSQGNLIPKLIDFGISKIVDAATPGHNTTVTGTAVGTPNYMSPEQARGDTTLDGRSDVWSVGAVMYEMLCGRPPFEAPTHTLLLLKIVTERPVRVDTVNPAVPEHLAAIVHRALEPDPAERYGSMRAMLSDLVESPAFDSASRSSVIPAAVWDELQLTAVARDVARAETLALPTPTLPGIRIPAFAAAIIALAAVFLGALGLPGATSRAAPSVIHATMPLSSTPTEPAALPSPPLTRQVLAAVDAQEPADIHTSMGAVPVAVNQRVAAAPGVPFLGGVHHVVHRTHPTRPRAPSGTASTASVSAAPASLRPSRAGGLLRPLAAYPEE